MCLSKKYFLFFSFIACFASCENSDADIQNLSKKKLGVEEAKDIQVTFTISGNTKAILSAPLMLRVQDTVPYIEFPNTIHVDFYNAERQIESTMDAHYARYKENENIVFLKDSVRVINILRRDTLYSRELYWDRNRKGTEFYTDKAVRVRTLTLQQNGTGLEASQDFKNWLITYPTGPIQVQSKDFPN